MLTSFYAWLESCFSWFFPTSLLEEPIIALSIKVLEFIFGVWLLYILIMKPILMLFNHVDSKIYGR